MSSKKKLQVPWLLKPVWYDFPMTKGLWHHRAPVGIILAANQKLSCTLESKSLDQVKIRLLNDDRKTEGEFIIESSLPGRAAAFNVASVSVPFMDCEYLKKTPEDKRTVSLSYPSDSKILPIYHFGGKEGDFFKLWDTQDAEFAYVESDYFGLLIPKIDKEAARELPNKKHLDDVIVFYDKMLTIYSQLIGLSFEETGTNKNVKNRFFIKADKNGYGMAYYEHWYTAVTSESIKSFWLDISPTNWGALHEIGHGHELKSISDETFAVGEVWNNILAFFYQTIMFGKDMATKGSKLTAMNLVEVLRSSDDVTNWGLLQKLSFLIHMFLKAGQKSFARFNQLTRQEFSGSSYYASGTLLVEKLMHFFAIDFALDMYPFMKLAKAAIGEKQLFEHYYVLSSVAYPLNYLISDTKEVETIKNKLELLFETSLVTPLELSYTELKNDLIINIDHHIFDSLFGDILKLMDGSRIVVEKRILSQTIILKNVPIGVYKIFVLPNPLIAKFVYVDFYAIVQASNTNELFLSAKVLKSPSLLQDKIHFLGVGDSYFATMSANPFKHLIIFRIFESDPHSYYGNDTYVSLDIKNQENEVNFSKSIAGKSSVVGKHEIYMDGKQQIEIFHAETKKRLKTDDPMMDVIIDRNSNTNYLILNELGFQNKNKDIPIELLEKSFLKKIEFIANKIRSKISLYVRPHCQPKYNLLLAVEGFECLFRKNCMSANLRKQYKDCLPPEYSFQLVDAVVNFSRTPNIEISEHKYYWKIISSNTGKRSVIPNGESSVSLSTIKFLGNSDKLIAKFFIDTGKCTIDFHVLDSDPHYRYINYTYIEITIRNKENKILFTKTLQGSNATKENYKIPFTDQVEIDIFHAEPSRLRFENPVIENMIEKGKSSHTLILTKELLNVDYICEIMHTDTGRKLPLPNDEEAISYSKINFLGIYDKYAAALYIDAEKSLIHFNVVSANPHWRYEGEPYFGVKLRNGKREIIFDKVIEGLHPTTEEFEIPFYQRVELEVFHAEPTRLRPHNWAMRYLIDSKKTTNHFLISREISSKYYVYEVSNAKSDEKVKFPIEELASPISLLKFRGKDDKHIATLYLDLHNDRILFRVISPKPHDGFKDKVYVSVAMRKEVKEDIFSKKVTGNDDTQQNFAINFSGRVEIEVFHAEPARLVSDNPKIENMIDHKKSLNSFVIKKSLSVYRKSKIEKHMLKHTRIALKRRKSI